MDLLIFDQLHLNVAPKAHLAVASITVDWLCVAGTM